jgi:hypothetical protein
MLHEAPLLRSAIVVETTATSTLRAANATSTLLGHLTFTQPSPSGPTLLQVGLSLHLVAWRGCSPRSLFLILLSCCCSSSQPPPYLLLCPQSLLLRLPQQLELLLPPGAAALTIAPAFDNACDALLLTAIFNPFSVLNLNSTRRPGPSPHLTHVHVG